MLKNKCLVICLIASVISFAAACSTRSAQTTTPEALPGSAVSPEASYQPEDKFEVTAWVDNPTPAQGEQVNLSGSLIKNGVYLGGMMMHAVWPDKNQERGVPNCKVLVIYQRGICIIETEDFNPGEYVPVTVKFVYNDQTFTGETGFTIK